MGQCELGLTHRLKDQKGGHPALDASNVEDLKSTRIREKGEKSSPFNTVIMPAVPRHRGIGHSSTLGKSSFTAASLIQVSFLQYYEASILVGPDGRHGCSP